MPLSRQIKELVLQAYPLIHKAYYCYIILFNIKIKNLIVDRGWGYVDKFAGRYPYDHHLRHKDSTIGIYISRHCTFVYISATFLKIARYMWCRTNEAIHWLLLLKG